MTLKSLTVSSGFVPTRSGGPLIVFSVLGSFDGTWFFRWKLDFLMEVVRLEFSSEGAVIRHRRSFAF